MMTFTRLMHDWPWQPIRGCPGRYVLRGARPDLSVQELVGAAAVSAHKVSAAPDTVLVAALDGGGLISYRRPDGTFRHTLNTPAGFARKLWQLGIAPPEEAKRNP